MNVQEAAAAFAGFVDVVKALRTPETGCPWDLEQDHLSLRPYLIEETYEVLEVIEQGNDKALCDELGDLLLQVVLHAQVADDRGAFSITDVVNSVREKMVRRHPHVFGETQVSGSDDVLKNWERIKMAESKDKADAPQTHGESLARIPRALPALLRAQRLGDKAAKVHFDWSSLKGVFAKVKEELDELEQEIVAIDAVIATSTSPGQTGSAIPAVAKAKLEHELGDVLFSLCQLARWLGTSAEDALRLCAERFISRFRTMENEVGTPLSELDESALEAAWQSAKSSLAAANK